MHWICWLGTWKYWNFWAVLRIVQNLTESWIKLQHMGHSGCPTSFQSARFFKAGLTLCIHAASEGYCTGNPLQWWIHFLGMGQAWELRWNVVISRPLQGIRFAADAIMRAGSKYTLHNWPTDDDTGLECPGLIQIWKVLVRATHYAHNWMQSIKGAHLLLPNGPLSGTVT